jgi:hypothetical protein
MVKLLDDADHFRPSGSPIKDVTRRLGAFWHHAAYSSSDTTAGLAFAKTTRTPTTLEPHHSFSKAAGSAATTGSLCCSSTKTWTCFPSAGMVAISSHEYETTIAHGAAPRLPRGAITQTDGLAQASTQIPRGFLYGKNLESKVMPAVGGKCDRPYGAYPLHGLLNGAVFTVHEIVSHKKPGSVLACGAMNEHGNVPADVLFSERKSCRKYAETMLKIAVAWRCIT